MMQDELDTLGRDEPFEATPAAPMSAHAGDATAGLNRLMWALCAGAGAILAIAAFTPVRHVTVAEGQVRPEGSVVELGHPEGGAVAQIIARPGEVVEAGAPLLRLDPASASADLGQSRAREVGLALRAEQLRALLEERAPRLASVPGADPGAIAEARAAFEAERSAARLTLNESAARVRQRQAEADTIAAQINGAEEQARIERERLAARRELLAQGWITPAGLSELELALAATEGEVARLRGRLRESRAALQAAESERAQAAAERRRAWSGELAEVTTQLNAIGQGAQGLAQRLEALEIRAPVAGVVQEVRATAVGGVLRPGEAAVRLVPLGDALTAEVRIAPQEVAQINPGDRARVTITAFDTELHEAIEGEVERVSPTTFSDPQGAVFYTATITLPSSVRSVRGEDRAIIPGMVVRAEIVGEERSLLQTLVRPIDRALTRALSQWG